MDLDPARIDKSIFSAGQKAGCRSGPVGSLCSPACAAGKTAAPSATAKIPCPGRIIAVSRSLVDLFMMCSSRVRFSRAVAPLR